MSPEERLRRLQDDDRWVDRPFVLRPASRPARARPAVLASVAVVAAAVAVLLVLGVVLQRPAGTVPPAAGPVASASSVPSAIPWRPARPGTGPLSAARPAGHGLLPLTADLTVPASARAGDPLEYRVTLRNPTAHAVALEPCPAYRESLSPAGSAPVVAVYVLNCGAVGALAPGASAVFAIRVPVPADAQGPADVRWSLTGGPSASGATTIRGATP